MDTINALYENGQITPDEFEKLSSIQDGFVEALNGGADSVEAYVHDVFGGCSEDELDKVAEIVEGMRMEKMSSQDNTDDFAMANMVSTMAMEKRAGILKDTLGKAYRYADDVITDAYKSDASKTAVKAAIVGTVGLHLLNTLAQGISTITHPINEIYDRNRTNARSEAALSSILKGNPELKADKSTFENFGLLKKYAPQTVATNKPLAETMLKKMQQWGGVDPQSLSQMIKMENDHLRNVQARSIIPETSSPSMNLGKADSEFAVMTGL